MIPVNSAVHPSCASLRSHFVMTAVAGQVLAQVGRYFVAIEVGRAKEVDEAGSLGGTAEVRVGPDHTQLGGADHQGQM